MTTTNNGEEGKKEDGDEVVIDPTGKTPEQVIDELKGQLRNKNQENKDLKKQLNQGKSSETKPEAPDLTKAVQEAVAPIVKQVTELERTLAATTGKGIAAAGVAPDVTPKLGSDEQIATLKKRGFSDEQIKTILLTK